jgi:hypothetical protein
MPVVEEKRRITARRLLLFYPLQGISANIIRGIFYVLLAILILGVGSTISDVLESPESVIRDDFSYLAFFAVATLVLRFWAVSAQNPRGGKRGLRPGMLRSALLLYRLGGISASLVRIAFYAYIAFAIWYIPWGWSSGNDAKQLPHDIAGSLRLPGLRLEFGIGQSRWGQRARLMKQRPRIPQLPRPRLKTQHRSRAPGRRFRTAILAAKFPDGSQITRLLAPRISLTVTSC